MAEELKIKDFANYSGTCSQAEAMRFFESEARAEKTEPKDESSLEQKEQVIKRNTKIEKAKEFYSAAQNYPELATKLYNITATNRTSVDDTEQKNPSAQLLVDENGTPYAKITHQMADGHFSFKICDGKVVFDKMNPEQIAEALMYLYHRGITNFEFPQTEEFQKAKEIINKKTETERQPRANQHSIDFDAPSNTYSTQLNEARQSLARAQAAQQQTPAPNQAPAQPANQTPAPAATPAKPKPTYEEVVADFEKWLGDNNQKKVKGLTYFKTGSSIFNGNITFSIYDKPNEDNYKNDGRPDKKGHYSECAYRVCLRQDHGKLKGIDFYVPNDGKLPDPVADKFALMVKAQGALYMKLPKTISPADAGVLRMACARNGILPKGIGINKFHANKMIAEAENNIQDEKALYKYKGNLGRHLLELGNNDPQDPRFSFAMSLINQEKLFPLKQQLEGCLSDKLTKRVNGGKAEDVIGAAQTMKQLFSTISAQPDMSIQQLCQKLSPQDRAFQTQLLQKLQAAGANGKKASSLDDAQMIALYESLEVKNIEEAKKTLNDKIRRNNGKDSIDTIVEREVNSASKALNITINKGLKDKGFKEGFNTIDFGTPTYEPSTNNTGRQAAVSRQRDGITM